MSDGLVSIVGEGAAVRGVAGALPSGVVAEAYRPADLIGRSPAMQRLRAIVQRLRGTAFSALVVSGETGTGKGLIARILHHAGPRAARPLVEVNCAALPRELVESELFGHEAGAFTGARAQRRGLFEQADGGTLFLDEIGELDLDLQAKLLSALEDRRVRRLGGDRQLAVDVRVIAASNRDLRALVADRRFRADLYHRLAVFQVQAPPLRTRREDIRDLVPRLVAEFNGRAACPVQRVPEAVYARLLAHDWPGNVRELRNVIERGVLLADSTVFPLQWLDLEAVPGGPVEDAEVSSAAGLLPPGVRIALDGSMGLEEMERDILRAALQRYGHNVTVTARALRVTRETLRYRIRKHHLEPRSRLAVESAAAEALLQEQPRKP